MAVVKLLQKAIEWFCVHRNESIHLWGEGGGDHEINDSRQTVRASHKERFWWAGGKHDAVQQTYSFFGALLLESKVCDVFTLP